MKTRLFRKIYKKYFIDGNRMLVRWLGRQLELWELANFQTETFLWRMIRKHYKYKEIKNILISRK